MPPLLALVLAAFLVVLMLGTGAVLWISQARRRAREYDARLEFVIGSYRGSWSPVAPAVFELSRRLAPSNPVDRLARLVRFDRTRADYPVRFGVVLAGAAVLATALAFAGSIFFGPLAWAAIPGLAILLCRMVYGRWEAARLLKLYEQFPDTLAMIVRSVRVGLPVVEAIRVVSDESPEPTRSEFKRVVDQTAIGVPLDQGLRDMAMRNGVPEYRFFATALSLQSQTGGALSQTLENLADTIRKRVATRLKARALSSEARTSAYILGALPIATGLIISVINPAYMSVLVFDSTGQKILIFGIGMLATGAFVMRTIIRKSLS